MTEHRQFLGVPFTLAVCAEMVFRNLPITERVERISALGFQVEIWDWTRHDIAALAATGATFSSMTGYLTGTLADNEGADELIRTAKLSIPVARQLGIPGSICTAPGLMDAVCRSGPVAPSPVRCG